MIICSCNVLSERDVRSVLDTGATSGAAQVYVRLGCRPQCGRCARTIRRLIGDSLQTSDRLVVAGNSCCAG